MSASMRICSSPIPSGTVYVEVSAKGTRTYSAWVPSIFWPEMVRLNSAMYDITVAEHPDFTLKKMLLSGSLAKGTALRALNDQVNPHAGAYTVNESLIAVRFSGAKTMIKMSRGQLEMKPAAHRQQPVKQRHRVGPTRKRKQDPLAAKVRKLRKKARDRINDRACGCAL